MDFIVNGNYLKSVASSMTVQTEEYNVRSQSAIESGVFVNEMQWTLCDRTATSNNKGNYFVSFGLPTISSELTTASTVCQFYPEVLQLNVDKILIAPITAANYSEYLDGRTFKIRVPLTGGTYPSSVNFATLYSSTYTSDKILKSEDNILIGSNVAFLFSDEINVPYSGSVINEIYIPLGLSANTTWNPDADFNKRPSAVSYQEVQRYIETYKTGTDARTNAKYAYPVDSSFPDGFSGFYKYDIPCGFVVLDKGFVVLTHPYLVNGFDYVNSQFQNGGFVGVSNSGNSDVLTSIYHTGITSTGLNASQVDFQDVNTSFQNTTICLSLPREFYISNNPSFNRSNLLSELNGESGIVSINPVYVSEVILTNAQNEVIAIAKLSQFVEKTYVNTFSFSIKLEY